jgi:hypothetical protein
VDVRSRGSVDVLPAKRKAHRAVLWLDLDPSGASSEPLPSTRTIPPEGR